MKRTYRVIFIASLVIVVLSLFIDLAIPRDEFIASYLAHNPSQWEIRVLDQDSMSPLSRNPEQTRSLLVQFLNRNQHSTYRGLWQFDICLLIVCAFSLLGWLRE